MPASLTTGLPLANSAAFRDLVETIGNDLGGVDHVSEGQKQLVRRAPPTATRAGAREAAMLGKFIRMASRSPKRLPGLADQAFRQDLVYQELPQCPGRQAFPLNRGAIEAQNNAFELVDAVTTKIREMPAKTFAGLAVKARALRFDTHPNTQCDLPPEDQDWPELVMNQFVAEIERLAAADLPRA